MRRRNTECQKKLNYTEEELSQLFSDRGYSLIDKQYVNAHHKHSYLCDIHVEYGIQNIALNHFKKGHGCKECANEKKRLSKRKYTIEEVALEFKSRGLSLLDNQTYKNNQQKLKFICENHIDVGIQEMSLDRVKSNLRDGCSICSRESSSEKQKTNFDKLISSVEILGYKVISLSSEYVNSNTKLKFYCNKHGIFEMQPSNLLARKRCPECGMDLTRGENSHAWNGGITALRKYLRECLGEWKKKSLLGNDFRCVLSRSKKNIEVHHLYSFKLILQDVFNEIDLEIKPTIGEYSNTELSLIKNKVLEYHTTDTLGTCLESTIHKLFHSIYGSGDNTPEQFEEFSFRYRVGEFDSLVNTDLQSRNIRNGVSFLIDFTKTEGNKCLS